MTEQALIDHVSADMPALAVDPYVAMVERLAIDPRVDVDKLDRLLQMQERIMDRNAKSAYARALADMAPELPVIERNGAIVVPDKGGDASKDRRTPYARLEDINEAIRAPMAKNGFAFSSRIETTPSNQIKITGILTHREGHSEETSFPLPHDSTGAKNAVQAIGSSITYGRRYTLLALLNITSHAPQDADDDGKKAGEAETIGPEDIAYVEQQLRDTGSDKGAFLKAFKVESIDGLTQDAYKRALTMFARKKAAK